MTANGTTPANGTSRLQRHLRPGQLPAAGQDQGAYQQSTCEQGTYPPPEQHPATHGATRPSGWSNGTTPTANWQPDQR